MTPQDAIKVPAKQKNTTGGLLFAIADTLPAASGNVKATYAKGYTTMYRAVLKILFLELAKASWVFGPPWVVMIVVVVGPTLLSSAAWLDNEALALFDE